MPDNVYAARSVIDPSPVGRYVESYGLPSVGLGDDRCCQQQHRSARRPLRRHSRRTERARQSEVCGRGQDANDRSRPRLCKNAVLCKRMQLGRLSSLIVLLVNYSNLGYCDRKISATLSRDIPQT